MKLEDIQQLQADGFLTEELRDRIVRHYRLTDAQNRFMMILGIIGGVLVGTGIILLISANWEHIPRHVKLAGGLLLMLGLHGAGWWIRERHESWHKTAGALHLAGSILFLGNIALIGQVYHLSSRPPNAILAWWLGIAPLAWILRSKAQHVLALTAFFIWLTLEFVTRDGWFFTGREEILLMFYPPILLALYAGGLGLERTSFREFAGVTQKYALLMFHVFLLPFVVGWHWENVPAANVISAFWLVAGIAAALVCFTLRSEPSLSIQWRWTWAASLLSWLVIAAVALLTANGNRWSAADGLEWTASILLFVHCLLLVQVGLQLGSRFLINLGLGFLALDVIICYLRLFGTMAVTGVMFIISGVGLLVLGYFLERRRRDLMRRLAPATTPTQP